MSKNGKQRRGRGDRQRHISVRGVRRDQPDLRKLSRALIAVAMEQAAAEAAAQAQTNTKETDPVADTSSDLGGPGVAA